MKLDPNLISYPKIDNIDQRLNVRDKTMKLSEENIGVSLCNLGLSNAYFNMTFK